ncbi:MAG TPA: MFS transporter [Acidimicrobiales bacterium]|nr:MFS transporter [Acidimicrobiales bacterium]
MAQGTNGRATKASKAAKSVKASKPLLANGRDETVDLGDTSALATGEALALRDMASHGSDTLPLIELGGTAGSGTGLGSRQRRSFRQLMKDSFDLSEIRRTPYGATPAVVLSLTSLLGGLSGQAFNVAGPEIARDLEVDITQLIGILVLVSAVSVFAALAIGWWADRHKRVPLVAAGTLLAGIMGAVTGRAQSMLSLGTPQVAGEVSTVAGGVPLFALVADYYPVEARGRVFAFLSSMRRVGQLIAIIMIGALVTAWGWRPTNILFGLIYASMGLVILWKLREPVRGYMERRAVGADDDVARAEDEPQSFGEAWRATWAIRTLRRLFISDIISNLGDVPVTIFFPFFLAERYHLNAFERGLLVLPAIVAGLVGAIIGGNMIDRFTRRNPSRVLVLLGIYSLVASFAVIVYALRPPLWILFLMGIPFGFGKGLVGPASSVVYSQVIPPAIRTQGLQVGNLATLPAFLFVGPVFGGFILSGSGYEGVFAWSVPFSIVGALVAISAAGFFDLDMRSALASSIASEEWRRAKRAGKGKLLVCRDVEVSYGNVQVLFGVDFDVEEGEIIALLGTNGAGKSTLLRAISGTTEANHGGIVFDGRDITHMPAHEIVGRGVVHMPGGRGVFPGLSVRENLLLGNWLSDDPEDAKARMEEVFEIFPILKERADADASSLSGGEQQQLSLAQAFLLKPRMLMIDELSLGLSPAVVAQLLDVVREIRKRGVTIIVVEQSVNVALTIAEKAIFMEKGEVKFFGNTADLLARPDILRAVYVKGTGALTDGPAGARRSEREERAMGLETARPVLEVVDLVKRYGGVRAVDGTSFALREGEVLGLIGPNGAGKTTIFDMISGFQTPDAGRVFYEGVDVTGMSPEERAKRKLVRRFQDARLFPSLTVFEALLVALEQRLEVRSSLMSALGAPQSRRAERRLRVRAERLIELLELGGYRDKFVKELSTGLRRILDLACVLAAEPRVLLLDEPSSGIAQREAESLAPLLRRVRFETGCSILIIEHDMPLISSVSDELIALDRGVVVTRGTPEEVLNNEQVIESYLGTTEAAVKRSGSM